MRALGTHYFGRVVTMSFEILSPPPHSTGQLEYGPYVATQSICKCSGIKRKVAASEGLRSKTQHAKVGGKLHTYWARLGVAPLRHGRRRARTASAAAASKSK